MRMAHVTINVHNTVLDGLGWVQVVPAGSEPSRLNGPPLPPCLSRDSRWGRFWQRWLERRGLEIRVYYGSGLYGQNVTPWWTSYRLETT